MHFSHTIISLLLVVFIGMNTFKILFIRSVLPHCATVSSSQWNCNKNIYCNKKRNEQVPTYICMCIYIYIYIYSYRTVPSTIWPIGQYFLSFSCFADLFHEPLGEWNNNKIWETREILAMLCKINVRQLAYRYHEKNLLSVTVIQHLSR